PSRVLCAPLLHCPPDHRHLHSFPTRRSSDLQQRRLAASVGAEQRHPLAAVQREGDGGDRRAAVVAGGEPARLDQGLGSHPRLPPDRKSTRLNSSHVAISYAVFCLKKKKKLTV